MLTQVSHILHQLQKSKTSLYTQKCTALDLSQNTLSTAVVFNLGSRPQRGCEPILEGSFRKGGASQKRLGNTAIMARGTKRLKPQVYRVQNKF